MVCLINTHSHGPARAGINSDKAMPPANPNPADIEANCFLDFTFIVKKIISIII